MREEVELEGALSSRASSPDFNASLVADALTALGSESPGSSCMTGSDEG